MIFFQIIFKNFYHEKDNDLAEFETKYTYFMKNSQFLFLIIWRYNRDFVFQLILNIAFLIDIAFEKQKGSEYNFDK